jgi:hypothetical protein
MKQICTAKNIGEPLLFNSFDSTLSSQNNNNNNNLISFRNGDSNYDSLEGYNRLRKSKSAFQMNSKLKSQHNDNVFYRNLNNYRLTGSIAPHCQPIYTDDKMKRRPMNDKYVNYYMQMPTIDSFKSANGTKITRKLNKNEDSIVDIIDYPYKNVIHSPGEYHEHYRMTVRSEEVPQNIRHKYGTKITQQLLDDQLKVHDTITTLQNVGNQKKNIKTEETPTELQMKRKKDESIKGYYDLSNVTRHSICRGLSFPTTTSTKETDYNKQISEEYFADSHNLDSPYRRKKDWLG